MKASILLALAALSTAHAAEPEKLMLACYGTVSDHESGPLGRPFSVGIVVNLKAGTIEGFPLCW